MWNSPHRAVFSHLFPVSQIAMPDKLLAVISIQGRDQKGVVAQFATFVAERGVNIEDLEQKVVSGVFVMDMLVDLREMTVSLDELITGSLELGKKIGMEVKADVTVAELGNAWKAQNSHRARAARALLEALA